MLFVWNNGPHLFYAISKYHMLQNDWFSSGFLLIECYGALIISPTGLFKRAILESGPAINPTWGRNTVEQGLAFGEMLKAALDCDNT